MSDAPNADQRAFWTDEAGHKWVAQQEAMDALLAPVLEALLKRAGLSRGDRVLDIGCGAGTSTLRAAEQVGPDGHVTGLDISDTLLALAHKRARGAKALDFIHADAATHDFKPQSIDKLISRFGVMFFDDTVAAFSHIRHALKPGAQITLASWGAIEENPYFKLAAKAAREVLGPMEKTDPDAPGPFAMRDPDRVIPQLRAAGFKNVQADRKDLALTPSGGLDGFARIAMKIGPAEASIRHFVADQNQINAVRDSLTTSFKRFEDETGKVEIPAEIIFYTAKA
ncbi:MAG: class I SAM-dependent methyltransferase [Pseudomonadota bacterium]